MKDTERLVLLYKYEKTKTPTVLFLKSPAINKRFSVRQIERSKDFEHWKENKGLFTVEEVIQGHWLKYGSHGINFVVKLHPDGMLTEWNQSEDPTTCWNGTWKLVKTALRLKIREYELDIIASVSGQVHSGIEINLDSGKVNAYFRCVHELS